MIVWDARTASAASQEPRTQASISPSIFMATKRILKKVAASGRQEDTTRPLRLYSADQYAGIVF
ncbi:hypothetical protein E2C01_080866 [Portunus trituberculatus]|uniref:Uncharacterized protein n=1 Tax=Portunus trituberculatus TaxID=210409 RepID=A0A5B7J0Q9_PORTR|nr:hypothetical protein [Portunus trituberculatus]